MLILFFWILFTVLVGTAAYTRNRSVIGWVVSSLFVSPFIALLFILILGKIEKPSIAEQRRSLGY
jgi:hypothetical protein